MNIQRRRILVKGLVQGVGFRPFIYQLANLYELTGWVLNSSEGVQIEAQGALSQLDAFLKDIKAKAPPVARIDELQFEDLPPATYQDFEIRKSVEVKDKFVPISSDIATCVDCQKELFDPKDRRYLYPFTNCTNCGPRFTIIEDIPYDRPKTTMKNFTMCADCNKEYRDPANRRFHAQPNACPKCGPRLEYRAEGSQIEATSFDAQEEIINKVSDSLIQGKIVAIKGLGGFHLACDATNDEAVKLLRSRKKRALHKPFAIMVADLEAVGEECFINEEEKKILKSPESPIVLLRKKPDLKVSSEVAPNNNYLGVMLAYTPLHHILLEKVKRPLVMTSGNISEEPIVMENEEAIAKLGPIADQFLLHNRDIYSRYDDSVTRVINNQNIMIRRARGYAPYPIHLPFKLKQTLAVGPELKNTFCLVRDNLAFVSQHIGDMENIETFTQFENALNLYKRLFRIEPEICAYDLHPEYLSTKYALSLEDIKLIGVQHHHAHIASCMVENGVTEPVIGVSFDGTGYGEDGNIWGGEFLICDFKGYKRVGHLAYVPMAGGEAAIKKPWRMTLSYLLSLFDDLRELEIDFLDRFDSIEVQVVKQQIDQGLNAPLTSSCGRLFDAVASLIGVRDEVTYEAQAAIELEMIADEKVKESYNYRVGSQESVVQSRKESQGKVFGTQNQDTQPLVVDAQLIFEGIINDLRNQISKEIISAKFHNTVVDFATDMCQRISNKEGIKKVAISGGVFQNATLTKRLIKSLKDEGFSVIMQKLVPTNDGGVSLGQAVIANFKK